MLNAPRSLTPAMLDRIAATATADTQSESAFDLRSQKLAMDTIRDLLRMHIAPVPRNYEIWFTHLSGANPELSRRLNELAARYGTITPELLETLYDPQSDPADADFDTVSATTGEIEKTTGKLLECLTETQGPLRNYGASLTAFPERIRDAESLTSLASSVAALASETVRVLETNRTLQEQVDHSAQRISTLRQSLTSVRRAATTDALTGLLNRRAFEGRARRAISNSGQETFTLLMADIDHFKVFNDRHGHNTGDLVLRLVARLLENSVKGRDSVSRYGGEEFAVLLAGAGIKGGESVARQICEAISSKPLVEKTTRRTIGRITLSIGVAQHRPGERLASLVERADKALYMAKEAGRSRVFVAGD